jgi:ADP-heptose:LPS heptosyltransferase
MSAGERPRSLLILRPGALGDAVLTLPLLEAAIAAGVRRVALLGTPSSWGFLARDASAPCPIELADMGGRDWLGLFGGSAGLGPSAQGFLARCDAGLAALGSGRAAIEAALRRAGMTRLAGVTPAARGDAAAPPPNADEFRIEPPAPGPAHAARRLLAALPALGIAYDEEALWTPRLLAADALLAVGEAERRDVGAALGLRPGERPLVLHPGSGGREKRWPAEGFAALAAAAPRLGLRPVLLLGPSDREAGEAVRRALPTARDLPIMANRPLREVLALLSLARAFAGNDSGISHLAARATAVLALFGPSDPLVWRPLGARVATLRAAAGRLAELAPNRVLQALERLLGALKDEASRGFLD